MWRESRALDNASALDRTTQLRKGEVERTKLALVQLRQQKVESARAVRQSRDELLSRHLQKGSNGSSPRTATAQECEQVSIMLNQHMVDIFFDPRDRSWYKLFVHMDDDLSGKINFTELEDMIRNELKIGSSKISEEQLRALWLSLDEDQSGLITAGEFGKFMRLGAHVHIMADTGRAQLTRAKKAEGASLRQENKNLRDECMQLRKTDEAFRKSKASEMYAVSRGLQAPADPRLAWRSPRALVY